MTIESNARASIGGNAPPVSVGLVAIAERFAELQASCSAWLTKCPRISDQEQADACSGFTKQITALEKEADALRKAEQEPHQARVNAIRESYRPIGDGLARMKAMLEPKLRAFLQAERERQEREQAERREAADLAARRAREASEAAARLNARAEAGELMDSGENVMATLNRAAELEREADDAARALEEAERAKPKAGAQHMVAGVKRSTSLRTHTVPVLTSLPKAAAYFAKQRNADLAEACLKAARAAWRADNSVAIPGVEFSQEEKAV